MKFFVNFTEMRISNVSVNLSGRDVCVTEHSLNRAKIGAIHEEIGGKGMAKSMRSNVFGDAG